MARGHKQSPATRRKISESLLAFHRGHSGRLHDGVFRHTFLNTRTNDKSQRQLEAFRTQRKSIAATRRKAYLNSSGDTSTIHNNRALPTEPTGITGSRRARANRPAAPKVIKGVVLDKRARVSTSHKEPSGSHASSALPTTGTKSLGKASSSGKKTRVLSSVQKAAKAERARRRRSAKKG